MNVREFIEELSTLDPEAIVIMSKDGEGNGFSPYSDYTPGFYIAETTWYGEFHSEDEVEEETEYDEEDRAYYRSQPAAVVLWPVN